MSWCVARGEFDVKWRSRFHINVDSFNSTWNFHQILLTVNRCSLGAVCEIRKTFRTLWTIWLRGRLLLNNSCTLRWIACASWIQFIFGWAPNEKFFRVFFVFSAFILANISHLYFSLWAWRRRHGLKASLIRLEDDASKRRESSQKTSYSIFYDRLFISHLVPLNFSFLF